MALVPVRPFLNAIALVALGALSGLASAQVGPEEAVTSTVTRAEVLADLQVWRESGLAALEQGDGAPDWSGGEYLRAEARYRQLRSAPAFAERVARIARERGEHLTSASAALR